MLLDPLHCYEKFIHAAGDHHWSRQNIWLVRTEGANMYNIHVHGGAPHIIRILNAEMQDCQESGQSTLDQDSDAYNALVWKL